MLLPWWLVPACAWGATSGRVDRRPAGQPQPGQPPAALLARIRSARAADRSPGSPARRGSGVMMRAAVGITARDAAPANRGRRRGERLRDADVEIEDGPNPDRPNSIRRASDRTHSWRCCVPKRSPPASSTRPSCFAMNCKRRRRHPMHWASIDPRSAVSANRRQRRQVNRPAQRARHGGGRRRQSGGGALDRAWRHRRGLRVLCADPPCAVR